MRFSTPRGVRVLPSPLLTAGARMRMRFTGAALALPFLLLLLGCDEREVVSPEAEPPSALATAPQFATTAATTSYLLLGHRNPDSDILRIDPQDGSLTRIGDTGFDSNASGMATARASVPGPGGSVYPEGTLFGLLETRNTTDNWVVVVDPETGAATRLVETSRDIRGRGIAFGPDGSTLYVIEDDGTLSTVSTVDGTVTTVGNTGRSSVSLEYDPDSQKFYMVSRGSLWGGNLYRIDPADGSRGFIGWVGIFASMLARSPDGNWFAAWDDALYSLDISAPSATRIGGSGLSGIGGMEFVPERTNEPPADVTTDGPYTGAEGADLTFSATGTDPEGTTVTFAWDFGDGNTATGQQATHAYADDGSYTVTLTATDGDGIETVVTTTATIDNVAPAVDPITVYTNGSVLTDPIPLGTAITASAGFGDPGTADTHTGTFDLDVTGSSGASATAAISGSTASAGHTYAAPGIYTLQLTVTDDDGGADRSPPYEYVVVYDPDGGFVTGGGSIHSPAPACTICGGAEGIAGFGFVSRYKPGASTPSGATRFQLRAGDLRFRSYAYEWLVVGGPKAQFKGSGTINGAGDYGFLVTVNDGDVSGGGVDRFRIKIWDKATETVVYDNQMGDADDADATSAIERGSIVIHSP